MLRIRELREGKGLFQKDIAKLLKITQAHYSRIESGEYQLSYEGLTLLSKFYNTSVDYILGLTNISKSYPRNLLDKKKKKISV